MAVKPWREPIAFWRASLETRKYDFDAYGVSAGEARETLIRALYRHCEQLGVDPSRVLEWADSVECRQVTLGAAYRDREIFQGD